LTAFSNYVGIPYIDRGRGIDGCDCYGLLRLVYRELRGIDLPSYVERYVTGADRAAMDALIAGELDPWERIERGKEQAFDGLLMREGSMVRHIGVVTEPGSVLHVEAGSVMSRIERYRSGMLKNRVVGFYRYRIS
jgi:cell wall-associated NlpC family hydrolase